MSNERTAEEIAKSRNASYLKPVDAPRCEKCKHGYFVGLGQFGTCYAAVVPGNHGLVEIERFGLCVEFSARQE